MGGKRLEIHIGEKYGHLTITGVDRERMKNCKYSESYVFADCDCGVCGKSYSFNKIKRGETRSCGHLVYQTGRQRKANIMMHRDGYGVIVTKDGTEFYYDLEDEHFLIGKYWYKDDYGYLTHCYVRDGKNYYIRFHRLIMDAHNGEYVDHVSRKKNDNRKMNLRICSHRNNDANKDISPRNKTGIIGVGWDNARHKWISKITSNYQNIFLGRYENIEDAIVARLKAEKKYFGKYAPQIHMFEEYGI